MHIPDWGRKPQAVAAGVIPALAEQLIARLTENVIAYAASVLLWFQARDSLTEHSKQGGCLKVVFPDPTQVHTHTHTIRAHTHPEGVEFYLWGSILCWPSQTLFLFFWGVFFPRTVMYALKDGGGCE